MKNCPMISPDDILHGIKRMTCILLVLLVVLVVFWGWFSSGLVIKLQRFPIAAIPATFGLPYESVVFETEDKMSLSGWFVPSPESSDTTIVVCHGWGANKSDILPGTVFLNQKGLYNLFYFDFRNHGDSGGTRTSLTTYEARDLEAAIRYVKENKSAESKKLAVYGLSMGGAVSMSVAASCPDIEAVVAESSFTSYNEAVTRFAKLFYKLPRIPFVPITLCVVRWRLGFDPEKMSPIYHIDKIAPRPVFLIQGDRDSRMPESEGKRLFAKAKEPKTLWTIQGADHGESAQVAGQDYQNKILSFYAKAFQ